MDISTNIELLQSLFPGQVLIAFDDAALTCDIAKQTARNLLSNGTLPFPTVKMKGRRLVSIVTLAAYLDSLPATTVDELNPQKLGRPRKIKGVHHG